MFPCIRHMPMLGSPMVSFMWGNSMYTQSLFILQKKIICIISNIEQQQTDSCKPNFKKHKILTLVNIIYILELCKLLHKYPDSYKKRGDMHTNQSLRHKNILEETCTQITRFDTKIF